MKKIEKMGINAEKSAVVFGGFSYKKSVILAGEALRIAARMKGFKLDQKGLEWL